VVFLAAFVVVDFVDYDVLVLAEEVFCASGYECSEESIVDVVVSSPVLSESFEIEFGEIYSEYVEVY